MNRIKKSTKIFLYFVLVAPILAKIFEWIVQHFTIGDLSFLGHGVWFFQLVFIEILSLCTYFIFLSADKTKLENVIWIPGIAYLLKEIYNFAFVYQNFNAGTFIAIFFEPAIILFIVSWIPYEFIFRNMRR